MTVTTSNHARSKDEIKFWIEHAIEREIMKRRDDDRIEITRKFITSTMEHIEHLKKEDKIKNLDPEDILFTSILKFLGAAREFELQGLYTVLLAYLGPFQDD